MIIYSWEEERQIRAMADALEEAGNLFFEKINTVTDRGEVKVFNRLTKDWEEFLVDFYRGMDQLKVVMPFPPPIGKEYGG